jgi:hypothetical protein
MARDFCQMAQDFSRVAQDLSGIARGFCCMSAPHCARPQSDSEVMEDLTCREQESLEHLPLSLCTKSGTDLHDR